MTGASDRVGTTLARKYRLDRIVGEGGMGVVYAGHHLRLDRPVAVKFLHPEISRDAQVVTRFFSEAQAAAKMQHPNVIDVYDLDQAADGSVFMVLELLAGESLGDRLKRTGPLARQEVVEILGPVLEALHQAHELGIVHRDLKPDNIFLSRDRGGALIPKILDFGIAKLADSQRSGTATGQVVGTPAYMAPEQAMGKKNIGPWTDIWAMGVVLYEVLTGRYPFDFSEDMAFTGLLFTIVSTPARPLREVWPKAPNHVALAVDRALAKEPTDRWPSMRALRAALEAAPFSQQETAHASGPLAGRAESPAVEPHRPGPGVLTGTGARGWAVGNDAPRVRGLVPWALGGVVVLLAIAGAVLLAMPSGAATEPAAAPHHLVVQSAPDAATRPALAGGLVTSQVPTAVPHASDDTPAGLPAATGPATHAVASPPAVEPAGRSTPTAARATPARRRESAREVRSHAPVAGETPATSIRRDSPPTAAGTWGTTVNADDM